MLPGPLYKLIASTVLLFVLTGKVLASSNTHFSISFSYSVDDNVQSSLIESSGLEEVFLRIKNFSEQNFQLKHDIIYHFRDYINEEEPPQQDRNFREALAETVNIYVPISFLYQLSQGLKNNYPQQPEVRRKIYEAAVEKYLWFEMGRTLIDEFELGISGQEVFALDNFSTLMLLNQYHEQTDFLLDATEAYLLIDQTIPHLNDKSYQDEIALDDERYRKAVCLILGKDYAVKLEETQQPYIKLLDELAWDQKRIELCQKLYNEKLALWFEALKPHLKDKNSIRTWVAAE